VPGQRIVAAGERGDRMYFIASGEVDVLVKPAPVRLKAGNFFGEIALLTDQRRVADVVAVGYCNFLVLRREDFERFRRANPEIEARIRSVAKERMDANVRPA